MLSFNEFLERAKEEVRCSLPDELKGAEPDIGEMKKIGSCYTSISVKRQDKNIPCPVANLTEMYEKYRKGTSFESLMRDMKEIVFSHTEPVEAVDSVGSYETMRERLYVRLSNAAENQRLLSEVPHRMVSDLALTYHVCLSSEPEELMSTIVTNQIVEHLKIDLDQLHSDAMRNSERILKPMIGPINEMAGFSMFVPMHVVTDTICINGSSVIMYPEVRRKLAGMFAGDFFIIPSSIHELIVTKYDPDRTEEFNSIVRKVNATVVSPRDRLSNHVYIYDSRKDKIKAAPALFNRTAPVSFRCEETC